MFKYCRDQRKVTYYSIKISVIISILCLNGCTTTGQTADCQKYWQAESKSLQIPIDMPKTQVKTKESMVKGFYTIANFQDKLGLAIGDLKFQEVKSQELQKKYISSSNALSQAFRDRANAIASLPGNPSETELQKVPPEVKQRKSDAFDKWTQSNDDWLEYCRAYAP
jgi:PBP1b-binding outer membrane lipoprotein LpoB